MKKHFHRILRIDASTRGHQSNGRRLSEQLIQKLTGGNTVIVERNLYTPVPLLSPVMVSGLFVPAAEQTPAQAEALRFSDALVQELAASDCLVISFPIYNFQLPAALKAWLDLVIRWQQTFVHTPTGSQGLLKNITAYVIITSGGTQLYSDRDFVSAYIKFVLGFIGITQVHLINATGMRLLGVEAVLERVDKEIESILHL